MSEPSPNRQSPPASDGPIRRRRRRPAPVPDRNFAEIVPADWKLLFRVGITIAVLTVCPWLVSMEAPFASNVWELPSNHPLRDWLWLFLAASGAMAGSGAVRPRGLAGAAVLGLGGAGLAIAALWLVLDQTPRGVVNLTGMAWGVSVTAVVLLTVAAGARLCLDAPRSAVGRGMLAVSAGLLLLGAFLPTELPVLDAAGGQPLDGREMADQMPWLFQIDVIGALFHREAGSVEFTVATAIVWIMLSPLVALLCLRHAVWPAEPAPDVRSTDRAPGLSFVRFWAVLFVPVLLLVSMMLTWLQAMVLTLVVLNMAVLFGVAFGAAAHGLAAAVRLGARPAGDATGQRPA